MGRDQQRAYWLPRIIWSAQRALGGQTPALLLAYSCDVDAERRLILLKAHLDGIPTLQEIDTLQVVDTEVSCDFDDSWETRTEFEIVITPYQPVLLPGLVYQRAKGLPEFAWFKPDGDDPN